MFNCQHIRMFLLFTPRPPPAMSSHDPSDGWPPSASPLWDAGTEPHRRRCNSGWPWTSIHLGPYPPCRRSTPLEPSCLIWSIMICKAGTFLEGVLHQVGHLCNHKWPLFSCRASSLWSVHFSQLQSVTSWQYAIL